MNLPEFQPKSFMSWQRLEVLLETNFKLAMNLALSYDLISGVAYTIKIRPRFPE